MVSYYMQDLLWASDDVQTEVFNVLGAIFLQRIACRYLKFNYKQPFVKYKADNSHVYLNGKREEIILLSAWNILSRYTH